MPADHLLGQRGAAASSSSSRRSTTAASRSRPWPSVWRRPASRRRRSTPATRQAFGRPIGVNQGVSFPIADLAVIGRGRPAAHLQGGLAEGRAAAGRRSVSEVKQAAAIAKLYSTEAAVSATRIATQVFGGNGFMEEYPVARFYRDAKILEIGEGTSEVQRMVIARGLGLPA